MTSSTNVLRTSIHSWKSLRKQYVYVYIVYDTCSHCILGTIIYLFFDNDKLSLIDLVLSDLRQIHYKNRSRQRYTRNSSLCYDVISRLQASIRLCQDVRHPKCVYILTYLNIHNNILQQLCQLMSGCDQWITSKCQVVSGLGSVYLDINNIISCHVSTSTTYYNCVSWLLVLVSKIYWSEYVILTHLIPVRSHIHICICHAFFFLLDCVLCVDSRTLKSIL